MALTHSVTPYVFPGLGLVLVEFKYEYEDRDGVLVTIKPNERYVLLAKTNDHWWQVRNDSNSKPFYIPARYVKELPTKLPSPLDFVDQPPPELVPHPVVAPVPVPVPVPVPKTLEDPGGSRAKQNDEVIIRVRPEKSSRHHRNENRMSTFGVLQDLPDLTHVGPSSRVHSNEPAGSAETGGTASSGTTNMADGKKQSHIHGLREDTQDSGKPRVPSFSPADPWTSSRPLNQPIPVEMPVVPPHSKTSEGRHDNKQQREEEEEEVAEEATPSESSEEEEEPRGHHIYESIQDLNLDLEALSREKRGPSSAPESVLPAAAPPSSQVRSVLSLETLQLLSGFG